MSAVPPAGLPWSPTPDGLALHVRVTPRGGRDAIDGVEKLADGHMVLKLRVRVPPDKGAANAAVLALIADRLGLAKAAVGLGHGATGRNKTVSLRGDPAELAVRLQQIMAAMPSSPKA
jgi:uncharacterized protein YggU (UPF0235/DUF167 family)